MSVVKTKKDLAEIYRRGRLTINRIEGRKKPEEFRMQRGTREPLPTIEQFRQEVPDAKIFKKLALFPFYSARKAKVVDKYADRILYWLGDYEKLAGYGEGEETDEAVRQMMADTEMYHFEVKIRAAIGNAKEFKKVIEEYGSFANYAFSFQPHENKENLRKLIADMQIRFERYGQITAMHFLMESGMRLPLIKPDLNMMRTFRRIGLVDKDNDIEGTWSAACSVADAADVPVKWVDDFVSLGLKDFFYKGSEVCGKAPICNRRKNRCEIRELCDWWQEHPRT